MGQVIGVDLGGTWMRAAAVSPEGTCGKVVRAKTGRRRPAAAIVEDLLETIRWAMETSRGIEAVAIGVPTTLDEAGGLAPSDNLPTMPGLPLARRLEQALHLPVALFNDADCFTLGEWWQGTGKGTRNFCGVTLGTGIGVGLVLNGMFYRGSHGCAGEIWKSPWETGRVEQRVCGKAIEDAYARIGGRRLPGEAIAKLAEQGEPGALRAFAEFGTALGRILAFIVNLVDPEAVALGGAMAAPFDFFRTALVQAVIDGTVAGVRVEASLLGERAALLGAGRLYWDRSGSKSL